MSEKLYAERDIIEQGDYYSRHTSAMTGEGLHSKSDIAAELAHRDIEIARLQSDVERLRGRCAELEHLIRYAQVESGVCMCGDEIESHSQASGHSPVDIWDHAAEKALEGTSEAWLLRKQSEAVEGCMSEMDCNGPLKYRKVAFDYAQRLRQQAADLEAKE